MVQQQVRGIFQSAPATVYVGFLVAVPLIMLFAHSMWTQTYVTIDRTLTFANYFEAFTDPLVSHLLTRSVRIAALVTLVTVLLAYPIAYFIAMRAKNKSLWLLLITQFRFGQVICFEFLRGN